MGKLPSESHIQWHLRIGEAAANFYSGALPISDFDLDNMCITVQVSDDPQLLARFTVDVIDAATSGDASARFAVDGCMCNPASTQKEAK